MTENLIVFVYGSSRIRCHNHKRLCESKYSGTFQLSGFKLYRVNASYPWAIQTNHNSDTIIVEAYNIDADKLSELDIL